MLIGEVFEQYRYLIVVINSQLEYKKLEFFYVSVSRSLIKDSRNPVELITCQ